METLRSILTGTSKEALKSNVSSLTSFSNNLNINPQLSSLMFNQRGNTVGTFNQLETVTNKAIDYSLTSQFANSYPVLPFKNDDAYPHSQYKFCDDIETNATDELWRLKSQASYSADKNDSETEMNLDCKSPN